MSSNGQHQSIGGEAHRDGGPSPNLGGRQDGWHQGAQPAPTAPASTEAKPADESNGEGELFVGLEDRVESFRDMIARGVMSVATLQKVYGLSPEEVDALTDEAPAAKPEAPAASEPASATTSAEARLAEIRALRQSNPALYWSDRIQSEELRCLEALNAGKADAEHDAAIKGFLDVLRADADTAGLESSFNEVFPRCRPRRRTRCGRN